VSGLGTDGRKELPFDFIFDPTDPTLSPFGSSKEIRDPNNDERDRLLAGRATWDRRLSHLASIEGEVSGLTGRIENDNRPNGGASTDFQNTEMKNRRGVGSLRARLSGDPALSIVLGADYRSDRVDRHDQASFGGFPSVSDVERGIHAHSLYGQAHGEGLGRILVDAGIRLDDHSIYGAYGVPRLALGVDVHELGLSIRGGYGRAFTAPTLTDLYYPGYGNEALRPERSTTWETGANGRWLGDRLTARATYHRTRFRDLIQSNALFVADNVGEARIEGEEYAVQLAPRPRLRIGGSAAHLIAKNLDTGVPLAKRPAWRFGAWGDGSPLEGVTVTAAWRWVDATRDPFDFIDASGRALRGDTPGYASLDLGAIASLRRWAPLEWSLKLTNALDRAYSEVKGFPARRRAITAGITFARG
jgi:vitamin B12 transporter